MNNFKIGDRIGFVYGKINYDHEQYYGLVVDISKTGDIKVEWDNRMPTGLKPHTYGSKQSWHVPNEQEFYYENELKKKYSELEIKFDAVAQEVKAKIKVAADNVMSAFEIAKKSGFDLIEMNVTEPLENAMDKAGWQTSSWYC